MHLWVENKVCQYGGDSRRGKHSHGLRCMVCDVRRTPCAEIGDYHYFTYKMGTKYTETSPACVGRSCAKCSPALRCADCLGLDGAVALVNEIIGGLPLLQESFVDLRQDGSADVKLVCSVCRYQVLNDGTPEREGIYPTTPEELRRALLLLIDWMRYERRCSHVAALEGGVLTYVGGAFPNLICYVCDKKTTTEDRVAGAYGVYHRNCEEKDI